VLGLLHTIEFFIDVRHSKNRRSVYIINCDCTIISLEQFIVLFIFLKNLSIYW
jgi:hypothetical protein